MLTRSEIQSTILESIISASEEYIEMSGGLTLHNSGIEQALSYSVGKAIWEAAKRKDNAGYVTLETSFTDLENWSIAKGIRGRRGESISHKGRVDIAYYDMNECLRGVIEMKRWLDYSNIEGDVKRVYQLLRRLDRGTIKWACLSTPAFVWNKNDEIWRDPKGKVSAIKLKMQQNFPEIEVFEDFRTKNRPDEETIDGWCLKAIAAASFFVKLKKN
jgi:hypothetical protein